MSLRRSVKATYLGCFAGEIGFIYLGFSSIFMSSKSITAPEDAFSGVLTVISFFSSGAEISISRRSIEAEGFLISFELLTSFCSFDGESLSFSFFLGEVFC